MSLRQSIKKLNKFFKKEAFFNREKDTSNVDKIAKALGISRMTVYRALKNEESIKKPKKPRNVKFDCFDIDLIRRVIYEFYEKKELPTKRMIINVLSDRGIYVSKRQLDRLLPKLGFKWKKVSENRKIFLERSEIRASRAAYLRQVQEYRQMGYQIVYLDETWVTKNHKASHCWLPNAKTEDIIELISNRALKLPNIPSGKGKRLIILHAGSAESGFIPNCKLVFHGKLRVEEDYHSEMNSKVFLDWFENQLIPELNQPSVIVLDNASYHNVRNIDCVTPTSSALKATMQEWLSSRNINFSSKMTKIELYALIKRHKPEIRYQTDEIAECNGHLVLRTPVRHCELNPIELIWAQVKHNVAVNNTSFKMKDVEKLTHEALNNVSKDNWIKCVNHVLKIENEMRRIEGIQESIDPVVIHFDSSSDDDDTEAYSLDSDTSTDELTEEYDAS